jgi:endonuclease/exonuclease/phosphatase family metal-dependent hydrolase
MSRSRYLFAVVAAGFFASACDSPPSTGIRGPSFKSDDGHGAGQFMTVMTQNTLLGTQIGIVLTAPPSQIPLAVGRAYALVPSSQPAERMGRIADQIVASMPDVVGLQEAVKWLAQRPGDFLIGNPVPASTVEFDLVQLILDALRERGADYRAAIIVDNTDIELPGLPPNTLPLPQNFFDVRLVDRIAILVRSDVEFWNVQGGNYDAGLQLQIGPVQKKFLRGWASVDVKIHGRTVRFVTTHLETQDAPPVQIAQAHELLAIVASSPLPVVMVGDFNSAANTSAPPSKKTATYGTLLSAGFEDAWTAAYPGEEGLTCCHDESLVNPTVSFDQRLDLVLTRGFGAAGSGAVVGEELSDFAVTSRWPSDHAGVFMAVRLP